jgi:hypothetical protein
MYVVDSSHVVELISILSRGAVEAEHFAEKENTANSGKPYCNGTFEVSNFSIAPYEFEPSIIEGNEPKLVDGDD